MEDTTLSCKSAAEAMHSAAQLPAMRGLLGVTSLVIAALLPVQVASAQVNAPLSSLAQSLLQTKCQPCHGAKMQAHGLRLDRRADALRNGDSGVPALVPGNSSGSILIKYVSGGDPDIVMPPGGPPLKAEEIQLLRQWIDAGAE